MDKDTRNAIERATQRARVLLEEDFASQLEGTFDVLRTGAVPQRGGEHLSARQRFVRDRIVAAIEHKKNAGMKPVEAVADYLRDAAFTALNRLVALKMLEARALVQECVTKGELSAGYKEFCGLAPGVALLPDSAGYRLYIESLFDELSTEVKVLFDRRDPASVLWPRRQTFDELLAVFNGGELACVWGEDETIGWVYQFFNSGEERRAMRDASQAPRNSRELAVRNQFFTPRYVVEFLTDNTLGRIWYEMRRGETNLASRCAYMVRSPNEVFCGTFDSEDVKTASAWLEGRDVPAPGVWSLAHVVTAYERRGGFGDGGNDWVEVTLERLSREGVEAFSTQELLDLLFMFCRKERFCEGTLDALSSEVRLITDCIGARVERARAGDTAARTQCVLAREAKDPRDLGVLDPACGSGHFLLYAFDLLVTIYEEAWADCGHAERANPASQATGKTLRDDYADAASLRRAIPTLILRHNLHGVDIDPRCAQIAQLALWMRAQRAFRDFGVTRAERSIVRRANIVVAEPMPGDTAMVASFAATLEPPVLGELFTKTVSEMRMAGDLGLLLRIDVALAAAITAAREQFVARDKELAKGYLPGFSPTPKQGELDLSGVDDQRFFEEAEARIGDALRRFVGSAAGGAGARRRLFAEDAAQGLGLVEFAENKFDVVLMNPPFGEPTSRSAKHESLANSAGGDLYTAFVSRGADLLQRGGLLGAITPRSFMYQIDFAGYRRNRLLSDLTLRLVVELGYGELDSASNRTAAYTVERREDTCASSAQYANLATASDKREALRALRSSDWISTCLGEFVDDAACQLLFRMTKSLRERLRRLPRLDPVLGKSHTGKRDGVAHVVNGLQCPTDARYVRLAVEVRHDTGTRWRPFLKPSDFAPYVGELNCVVNWDSAGKEQKAEYILKGESPSTYASGEAYYLTTGVWFPDVSERGIGASLIPFPSIPGRKGLLAVGRDQSAVPSDALGGFLNSILAEGMLGLITPERHHKPSYVGQIPWLAGASQRAAVHYWRMVEYASQEAPSELSPFFVAPDVVLSQSCSLAATTSQLRELWRVTSGRMVDELRDFDREVLTCVGATDEDASLLNEMSQRGSIESWFPTHHVIDESLSRQLAVDLISFAFGVTFGRWGGAPEALLRRQRVSVVAGDPRPSDPSRGRYAVADDPGHRDDVLNAVTDAIAQVWRSDMNELLAEVASVLGAVDGDIRGWIAGQFFGEHVGRYSRSRRKAPIYWQLSTTSTRYGVWVYLSALTADALFGVQRDYIAPKLAHEERKLEALRSECGPSPAAGARKLLEDQRSFVEELRAFLAEVKLVTPLWTPHLDDGVVINAAPLWRLFPHHKPWQKELLATWQSLCGGDCDWSHMAMHLWPERVVPKCADDRSLAIAHALEDVFWLEGADGKWKKRERPGTPISELVKARTSAAVKEALKHLLDAATASGAGRPRGATKRSARLVKGEL